jgi:hypothetical protein
MKRQLVTYSAEPRVASPGLYGQGNAPPRKTRMTHRILLGGELVVACAVLALACNGSTENAMVAAGPGSDGMGTTSGDRGSGGSGSGRSAGDTSGVGGVRSGGVPTTDAAGAGGAAATGTIDGGTDVDGAGDGGAKESGSGCAAPGTICWDFEEGKVPSGWVPYRNEFNGSLVVDGTRPRKGSYSLHAKDFSGGVEGQQGGPKHTIRFDLPANFGPVLWGRAYVYTTPARPMSHAGIFNARYPRPNATSTAIDALDWYEVATYMQKYMSIWHPPEPPGYPEWVQVSDTMVVLDGWACIEWLFDGANGANGEAADPRVWLEGTELTWPAPFVFSDPATTTRPTQEKARDFTVLETGAYLYQGLPTTTNWWIDDLAVGKQRIGCN